MKLNGAFQYGPQPKRILRGAKPWQQAAWQMGRDLSPHAKVWQVRMTKQQGGSEMQELQCPILQNSASQQIFKR